MRTLQHGYTLIELMTTLTMVAILVGLAIPSFRQYTANSEVTAATNDLVTAINTARSEALHRATTAAVCSSTDGATCAGGPNWTTGWIVYYLDSGGVNRVVQAWPAVQGAPVILQMDSGGATALQYDARGMSTGVAAATFNLQPTSCTSGSVRESQVTVSVIGSVSTTKIACP
jgi:type IV fimbrial biogenesis protein FimT